MNIVILVGSSDKQSHSLGLGKAIESELKESGADTRLINLIEYGMPL